VSCNLDTSNEGNFGFIFPLEQNFLKIVQPWRGIVLRQKSVTVTYL